MSLATEQLNIVLVSGISAHIADFQSVLNEEGHQLLILNHLSEELASSIILANPDLIIFDIDDPRSVLFTQISIINEKLPRPIIMFTSNDDRRTINLAINSGVAAHVVKGYDPQRIMSVVNTALARFSQTHSIQKELHDLKTQLEDRKVIEKAKGIMMKKASMDEATAYTSLRNMAMNKNMKLVEIARSVITTSELMA